MAERLIVVRKSRNIEVVTNPKTILAVGAHSDDPEQFQGGTISMLTRAGHTVHEVIATNGQNGTTEQGATSLVSIRRGETRKAAAILGIRTVSFLDSGIDAEFGVSGRQQETVLFELVDLLREIGPDVAFTHPNDPAHEDHAATGRTVVRAVRLAGMPTFETNHPPLKDHKIDVFFGDEQYAVNSHGQYTSKGVLIAIDEIGQDEKEEAFLAHDSQGLTNTPGDGKSKLTHQEMTRRMGFLRGMQVGVDYAEGFDQLIDQDHPQYPADKHPLVQMLPGRVYFLPG